MGLLRLYPLDYTEIGWPLPAGGRIVPGDVVFHYERAERIPFHVGLCANIDAVNSDPEDDVYAYGVPAQPSQRAAGYQWWRWAPHDRPCYKPFLVGHHPDHGEESQERCLALLQQIERQIPAPPFWNWSRDSDDESFRGGTCVQFVEWFYERMRINLIDQVNTRCPAGEERWPAHEAREDFVYVGAQIAAFHQDRFGCAWQWEPTIHSFPECLNLKVRE